MSAADQLLRKVVALGFTREMSDRHAPVMYLVMFRFQGYKLLYKYTVLVNQ